MKMGYGVTEAEVEDYYVADIPTAYPVYELNFEDHLIPVLEGVHAVPNLLTLGRHGLFLNNSMDDNVLLGMKVADHIAARRLRQPRLAVRDARVHEPAVRGEVSGRQAATAPIVASSSTIGCAGSDCRASVSSGKCTAVM